MLARQRTKNGQQKTFIEHTDDFFSLAHLSNRSRLHIQLNVQNSICKTSFFVPKYLSSFQNFLLCPLSKLTLWQNAIRKRTGTTNLVTPIKLSCLHVLMSSRSTLPQCLHVLIFETTPSSKSVYEYDYFRYTIE